MYIELWTSADINLTIFRKLDEWSYRLISGKYSYINGKHSLEIALYPVFPTIPIHKHKAKGVCSHL